MKSFDSGFLARLNAQYNAGVFLEALKLTESPSVTKYFVNAQRSIVFQGQTYTPLSMQWEGVELSATMALPSVRVTVPSIMGEVEDYLELTDITGQSVVLQIFHLDLLGVANAVDEVALEVMAIQGRPLESVTFHLGLDLTLTQQLPRHLISSEEFPGIPDTLRLAA